MEWRIGCDCCDIIMDELYEALRAHHIEHFPDGGKGGPERLIVFLRPSSLSAFSMPLPVGPLLFPSVKALRCSGERLPAKKSALEGCLSFL